MRFRTVAVLEERERNRAEPIDVDLLDDDEKERLCRMLLAEFGVTHIKNGPGGELIHQCCLPLGGHSDRNSESASLNYRKLAYNCFVCGNSGGLLWFIGVNRDCSGKEARDWLHEQTGLGGAEVSLSALLDYFDAVYDKKKDRPPPIPHFSMETLDQWMLIHPWLTDPRDDGGRGIPEPNIEVLKVGYGVFDIRNGDDWVRGSHRIVIPHVWDGNLVGWQTRRITKDGTSKYRNTPDFPKDTTIYNFHPRCRPVVVESAMTVIAKHHILPNLEATFSASVTDRQTRLLRQHASVVLWFDNDEPGWKATNEVAEALEGYTDVWVVDNPWAEDAADLPDEEVLRLVEEAVPYACWTQPKALTLYAEREEAR